MLLIRPCQMSDLDDLMVISHVVGNGMTSMPADQGAWREKLSAAAREVIGKPHHASAPALHLLQKEGFEFSGHVDLFDGGPSVQARAQDIHTVRDSCTAEWRLPSRVIGGDNLTAGGNPAVEPHLMMLSNGRLENYRLTLAPARLDSQGYLVISPQTIELLQLTAGAPVRYIRCHQPAWATAATCAQAG